MPRLLPRATTGRRTRRIDYRNCVRTAAGLRGVARENDRDTEVVRASGTSGQNQQRTGSAASLTFAFAGKADPARNS